MRDASCDCRIVCIIEKYSHLDLLMPRLDIWIYFHHIQTVSFDHSLSNLIKSLKLKLFTLTEDASLTKLIMIMSSSIQHVLILCRLPRESRLIAQIDVLNFLLCKNKLGLNISETATELMQHRNEFLDNNIILPVSIRKNDSFRYAFEKMLIYSVREITVIDDGNHPCALICWADLPLQRLEMLDLPVKDLDLLDLVQFCLQ